LTAGLAGLLRLDGPWGEAITRHHAAVEAAQHLGDRLGQANALSGLGGVRRATGEYRPRPRPWSRRWACTATSASGSARPTPSTAWGTCGG
jgi:Tetratricopeptide repeat